MKTLVERFVRYAKVSTASDPNCSDSPSSKRQFILLEILKSELIEMGLNDVYLSSKGVLYGKVPGGTGEVIGLIAHVDTSPDSPGENVKPQLHENWDGTPIVLEHGVVIDPAECSDILRYQGGTIITSDGSTLLGADDKAGVAIIMETCRWLMAQPDMKRPGIVVAFTPDEEVGRGMDNFDTDRFGANFAYTIDGSEVSDVSAETFNAYSANLKTN